MRVVVVALVLAFLVGTVGAARPGPGDAPAGEPLRVLVACQKNQLAHYQEWLEKNYNVRTTWAGGDKGKDVAGLEQLEKCDVLLLNLYRTEPSDEQLGFMKAYAARGRPVVGLRKASHAFQNWLDVAPVVFGAEYGGHFLLNKQNLEMTVEEKAKNHPLLEGYKPFLPGGGLYKYTKLAADVEVLVVGGEPGNTMPQIWARHNKQTGARAFYTRHDPNDLKKDEGCRQMVARALFWAAGRQPEPKK